VVLVRKAPAHPGIPSVQPLRLHLRSTLRDSTESSVYGWHYRGCGAGCRLGASLTDSGDVIIVPLWCDGSADPTYAAEFLHHRRQQVWHVVALPVPSCQPASTAVRQKEPNFFGQHSADYIANHIDEYFSLFPTSDYRGPLTFMWEAADEAGTSKPTTIVVERQPDVHYITGEASANTFYDVAPSMLHRYLPDTRLIVLLRNPVERAYSHHRMYQPFPSRRARPRHGDR
jgi:hypothetical protein